jgi:hypothetical protein
MDKKKILFKTYVPPGTSSFQVIVTAASPVTKCKFSNLLVIPDYYSRKAAALDLDSPEAEGEMSTTDFHLTYQFLDEFYSAESKYVLTDSVPSVAKWLKDFNTHFDSVRPPGTLYPPVFFDWIHTDLGIEVESLFGGRGAATLLPSSIPQSGLNPYLLPSNVEMEKVRIRVHIAPNVKVSFSTDGHLKGLGFGSLQIGKRRSLNQFVWENPSLEFITLESESSPQSTPIVANIGKVMVGPSRDLITSANQTLSMTRKDFGDNQVLSETLKKVLKEIAILTNIEVKLKYEDGSFQFEFPTNPHVRVAIHCQPQLAIRLGYGMVYQIHRNSIHKLPNEEALKADACTMAETLVQDTAILAVRQSSNVTSEVAHLFPTQSGTMALMDATEFYLPRFRPYVHPAIFELQTYDQHNPVPLQWVTGAYVSGVLTVL